MVFGLPDILLTQAMAGVTSLATLATVRVWLPTARGDPDWNTAAGWAVVASGAALIWLPSARGVSKVLSALTLKAMEAKAATPIAARRIRFFTLIFFLLAVLHCAAECCYWHYPGTRQITQRFF
jgi:hypothetical protein